MRTQRRGNRRALDRIRFFDALLLVGTMALALGATSSAAPLGAQDTTLLIGNAWADAGDVARVGFFYVAPTEQIQGFSIAVGFDCELVGVAGSFDIEGTVLETVGTEFISQDLDLVLTDGDGCELVIGILLDALPPFENQSLPVSLLPALIGRFDFQVPDDAPCPSSYTVAFADGANGTGTIPIQNTVVVENESVPPDTMIQASVFVPSGSLFVRGDSNNDGGLSLADVIFGLNYLFLEGPEPVCFDAVDANDDGLLNATDPVFLSLYLFLGGLPPFAPFPDCGAEPESSVDALECRGDVTNCPLCP